MKKETSPKSGRVGTQHHAVIERPTGDLTISMQQNQNVLLSNSEDTSTEEYKTKAVPRQAAQLMSNS